MWFKYVAWIWLLAIICCVPTSFANEGQDSANEYSSLVSVRVDRMHRCTGAILAPSWVLTTYSCIERTKPRQVTIEYDVQNPSLHGENFVSIKKWYLPAELARIQDYPSDLILIQLQEPMTYENMSPVLLPSKDDDLAGELVEVTGWTLNYTPSSYVINQQTVKVKVESSETCAKHFGSSETLLDYICAKYEGDEKTAPNFFSAATLMNEKTLVGVASWFSDTGNWHVPNVYNKISVYTEWIASTMKENGMETPLII